MSDETTSATAVLPHDAPVTDRASLESTAPVPPRRHFGFRDRPATVLACALGVALIVIALWHSPIRLGNTIDAIAAVPLGLGDVSTPSVPVAIAPLAVMTADSFREDPSPIKWSARATDLLAVATGPSSALDGRLMRVYGLIAQSEVATALEEARRLANEFPDYGLAQLIYADLLAATTSPTREFASPTGPLSTASGERLRELLAEAHARVAAAGQRPPAGSIPAQFVRLDPKVRHAIAVDVSRSRVYVLENTPTGLVVKRDYYASVGKLGMSKQVEGDLRTPLGVYFVTGRIASSRLHQRYGATALSLNYPNQYDLLKGRTGSGIWLHGVEANLFTRAPLATDGCVALSNPDLLDLTRFIERQATPIVIADRIQWVDAPTAAKDNAAFLKTFEAWRAARQTADLPSQARFYADPLDAVDGSAAARLTGAGERQPNSAPPAIAKIDDVSMLSWHDQGHVMVVTYSEKMPHALRGRMKRQYWREEGGAWQVLYEGTLG